MSNSDVTLVRRERVAVTRRLMAAEVEYAKHAEDTSTKIAELQGTVDRLQTELAEKRGRMKTDNATLAL